MDIKARFFELAAQRLSLRPGDLERLRRCVATEPVNANGIKFRLLILAQLGLGSISGPTQHDDAMLKMIDEWAAANNSAPAVPLAGELRGPALPHTGTEPSGAKKWTPRALDALAADKAELGTKGAAEKHGISTARVRKLLPSDDPPPKGYSAFNQRTK